MKDVLGTIAGLFLWLIFTAIGLLGLAGWWDVLVGHFWNGSWFMILLDIVFVEVIIPVVGLIHFVQYVFL